MVHSWCTQIRNQRAAGEAPFPAMGSHESLQKGECRQEEALDGFLPNVLGQELQDDGAADGDEEHRLQSVDKVVEVLHRRKVGLMGWERRRSAAHSVSSGKF